MHAVTATAAAVRAAVMEAATRVGRELAGEAGVAAAVAAAEQVRANKNIYENVTFGLYESHQTGELI